MKKLLLNIISFTIISFFSFNAVIAGNVSGVMVNDTTWASGNSPVIVTGNFTVPAGKTLTIEPGTVIKFQSGTSLFLAGKLLASGTKDQPIYFTSDAVSPAAGDWGSIEFQNTANVGSTFSYCIVEYGGGTSNSSNIFYKTGAYSINVSNIISRYSLNHGINVRASSPTIFKSRFTNNNGYGVFTDLFSSFMIDSSKVSNNGNGIRIPTNSNPKITATDIDSNGIGIYIDNSAVPTIQSNNIRKNATGIIFNSLGSGQPTISNNTIAGNSNFGLINNGTQVVAAERNFWGSASGPYHPGLNPTGKGNKVSDYVDFQPFNSGSGNLPVVTVTTLSAGITTWTADNVYRINANLTIGSGQTLKIMPGTIVKFASTYYLRSTSGSLIANGKPDSLIVFTSGKDDSYGGDSNNDGTATGPNPGDWNYISFESNSSNSSVKNAIVKFAGNSSGVSVYVESCTPSIKNIFVSNSSNDGIQLYNTTIVLDSLSITGNNRYGIRLNYQSTLTLTNSSILLNKNDGIFVNVSGNQRLALIDNNDISFNSYQGIYDPTGSGDQTFSNNRFKGNGYNGVFSYNLGGVNTFSNNLLEDNLENGIATSKAIIQNNIIKGNKFPIALYGTIDNTYSGNTITGNSYNNALALFGGSSYPLRGVLSNNFPDGMTSKTYAVIGDIRVNNNDSLQINEGVILKFHNKFDLQLYGRLLSKGTPENPIVFTSYRDASYGGKTNLTSDLNAPNNGDWGYVYLSTNPTNSARHSILKNMVLKFGGSSGMLYLEGSGQMTYPIENLIVRKSSNYGIYSYYTKATFNNVRVDSNNTYGIRLYSGSNESDITITNSVIKNNGSTGLNAENISVFRLVSNCDISNNGGHGIYINNSSVPQTYLGNTISGNQGSGIANYSPSVSTNDIQYIGNTISGNKDDGILTTASRFIDNTLSNNRFPISVWGRMGNRYTDNDGVDGNIISGNQYNNSIAIYSDGSHPLTDTLRSVFPIQMPSKVYTAVSELRINNGNTLKIEAGAIIKFNPGTSFSIYGKLLAVGTPEAPIVFTSYRDHQYGGKTNLTTDLTNAAPGNWYYLYFDGAGAKDSRLEFVRINYAGQGTAALYTNSVDFTNDFDHISIKKSAQRGIYMNYSKMVIDHSVIDSNASYGIQLYSPNQESQLKLRNTKVRWNGNIGVWAYSNSTIREVSSCDISFNNGTGIATDNSNIPQSYVNNLITGNLHHGIYSYSKNDGVDTLILIAGNKIKNNGLVGILTSRALIIDDSLTGNRYAVGGVGQLSKSGTNQWGHYYSGNVVEGNVFNNAFSIQGVISGRLGFSYPNNENWVVTVRGDANVTAADSLSINEGTVIKFPKEYGSGQFEVNGFLVANGTLNEKIVFTSFRDDTYGGDTNADSSATPAAPGNWWGIYINGANNNKTKLKNVIVRFGSYNIYAEGNAAKIDSSFSSYASHSGLYLSNSSLTLNNNEIHHNYYGIYNYGSSNPVLRYNNFHDNSNSAFYNNTDNTISAINNYWGDATGPYVNQGSDQNLTGLGNKIILSNGPVTYRPFLTTRTGVLAGDVTENGTISAYDASYVLQYIVSLRNLSNLQLAAADVSSDGTVSAYDASLILQYSVGIISGFPSLGKINPVSAESEMTAEKSGNELVVRFNAKNAKGVQSSDVSVSFNSEYLKPVSYQSLTKNTNASIQSNVNEDHVKIAIASTTTLESDLTIAELRFEIIKPMLSNKINYINVKSFRLNETSFSSDLNAEQINNEIADIPESYEIAQNYPNPFNPTTTIRFDLPVDSKVNLTVYNLLGQRVVTLIDGNVDAGYQTQVWNGKDSSGKTAASGVYLYRIEAVGVNGQKFVSVKRMMMVK